MGCCFRWWKAMTGRPSQPAGHQPMNPGERVHETQAGPQRLVGIQNHALPE
jgi:hypothetical protein